MKKFAIGLAAIIILTSSAMASRPLRSHYFDILDQTDTYMLVVDPDTHIEYTINQFGTFTPLLDMFGQPKVLKEYSVG